MKSLVLACLSVPLIACSSSTHHDPIDRVCDTGENETIEEGATTSYTVGVDAGYYFTYGTGGLWHVEWTCDTALSGIGCNFTGTINVITPDTAAGANVVCTNCESNDILTATETGDETDIDFDMITTDGIDGIDFDADPGSSIVIDLQINGVYQNDLVYIPSFGASVAAPCMPLEVIPNVD